MAVLPDGRVVSGSWDATVRIWNPSSRECELELKGHTTVSRWVRLDMLLMCVRVLWLYRRRVLHDMNYDCVICLSIMVCTGCEVGGRSSRWARGKRIRGCNSADLESVVWRVSAGFGGSCLGESLAVFAFVVDVCLFVLLDFSL